MTKSHWLLVIASVGLFALLYWGFDTKPSSQKVVERSRQLSIKSTDVSSLLEDAREELPAAAIATLAASEQQLEAASDDSTRADMLKQLAGQWYDYGFPAISGFYAEEVGKLENSPEAWSIAGSTYYIGIQRSEEKKVLDFCRDGALRCFESAVSLEPEVPEHQLNLALTYTAAPPPDNPMKGVLMLRNLQQKFPENAGVLVQLGRLAIQTGQYERATERLQQALELEPDNSRAVCLLAEAWRALGRDELAAPLQKRCAENR